ncbi:MAG: GTPase Era [Candidatus Omnitrophica bacterium]|nr:GTPase Era [Candidatus Omnitrophota bacterium]
MPRSGFIAISGQPNVGKSTIINGLLGEKVAIVSARPETTRDNIRGVLTEGDIQAVFIDSPGIHKPHDLLGKVMVSRAQSTIMEADIVMFVTEKSKAFNADDMNIISRLPERDSGKKVVLVINKSDKVRDKTALLPLLDKAAKIYPFSDMVPMSALNEKHLKRLLEVIKAYLPEGPFFYPEEQLTDRTDTFMVQEIIREKVLTCTYEEVPHSAAVVVEGAEEDDKGHVTMHATIYVERVSQRSIVIGKNGEMIKKIRLSAKRDIEKTLGRKISLELWIKVRDKWKKDPHSLREMGYGEET